MPVRSSCWVSPVANSGGKLVNLMLLGLGCRKHQQEVAASKGSARDTVPLND